MDDVKNQVEDQLKQESNYKGGLESRANPTDGDADGDGQIDYMEYSNAKATPLKTFGPGVSEFFRFLEHLIWVFGFISILACVQMHYIGKVNPAYLSSSAATMGR